MDWNGILGSVASVVNTALPLFFGSLKNKNEPEDLGKAARIGPATLYQDGGTLKFGHFNMVNDSDVGAAPIVFNFAAPEGGTDGNLSLQLNFGQSFNAEQWIAQYSPGSISIGTAEESVPTTAGPLEGIWSFVTQAVLTVANSIQVIVNPTLTLRLVLQPSNNCVLIVAIGAATVLGTTYMITTQNNSGKGGSRSGALAPASPTTSDAQPTFSIALPTGVDFSQGLYGLNLQLAVVLSPNSVASDARVVFETVSQEKISKLRASLRA